MNDWAALLLPTVVAGAGAKAEVEWAGTTRLAYENVGRSGRPRSARRSPA